ncbi:MAG: hypothetical protein LBK99_26205 [Opitutaceae bacterium]|jgi:CRISPR-associated protein Cmr3|nr:hypothetical protein [Opitutaceae bacterium]
MNTKTANNFTWYALTPQDAWFFRDGRPYNKYERETRHTYNNQTDANSQFPPSPRTLTGAVRAALARANGWNGECRWSDILNTTFGNGPDNLGVLRFTAPFLLRNSKDGKDNGPLLPAPLHFLAKSGKPAALLQPAEPEEKTLTDISPERVRLPVIATTSTDKMPLDGLKSCEAFYVSHAGFEKILAGHLPEKLIHRDELWTLERRVALERDPDTLNTGEGALYNPAFVRLAKNISLGFGIAGIPSGFNPVPSRFILGGESRMALCERIEHSLTFSSSPPPAADTRFAIVALSPVPCSAIEKLPGLVSACIGKPLFFGGWDSLTRKPLPLEPFHPPGSVWFCEPQNDGSITNNTTSFLRDNFLGDPRHTAHGFGQIALAHWPRNTSTSNAN